MKSLFIEKEFKYDGSQLRSLFAYEDHGLLGDSVVVWIGECDVQFTEMVDVEDLRDRSAICGSCMVHFIIEKFGATLPEMVALQRLFAAIAKDRLATRASLEGVSIRADGGIPAEVPAAGWLSGSQLIREGDDLYVLAPQEDGLSFGKVAPVPLERRKLSISIATVSPVSGLIHFAINVSSLGTPVKTASLEDLGIDPKEFAAEVLADFVSEATTIKEATMKVRWVK